jgi:tRNA dimethylallyltransferase
MITTPDDQLPSSNNALPQAPSAIAIVGATASGKTATSLELAALLALRGIECEIISADSRQLYRHLSIGTAKPSQQELARVPHHFIDCKNPDEMCSAGEFGAEAAQILAGIRKRGKLPLIVGGAGLYVRALTDGFFDETADIGDKTDIEGKTEGKTEGNAEGNTDTDIEDKASSDEKYEQDIAMLRSRLNTRLETEGYEVLYAELQVLDPVSASKYAERNPRRIIRALEYYYATGTPLSTAHQTSHVGRDFTTQFFGVDVERQELYKRINTRTELMFRDGIIEETASVLSMGYAPTLNALNTVGYKECLALLRGDMSRARALELTQQNTRRYAKRQLTWFRRDTRIRWGGGSPKSRAETIAAEIFTPVR